jgi:hypothetical protein
LSQLLALRRELAALQIFEGLLVGRDDAGAGAALDGHVAEGHAAFHRKVADGAAAELDGVAGAAGGADLADDGQRDVLRRDAGTDFAVDLDEHALGALGDQGLRGQHVLDFGGADAEGQRAEGAVGGGVAVAAHHGHAGQRRAVLRADDVDDALVGVLEGEVHQRAEVADVGVERLHLQARDRVLDAFVPVVGRRVVVGVGDHALLAPRLAAGQAQALEGLRAGHLVHEVAVDVEQARAVGFLADDVRFPEFVVKRLASHVGSLLRWGGLLKAR